MSEPTRMSATQVLFAAAYGDGRVPEWFRERVKAVEVEAERRVLQAAPPIPDALRALSEAATPTYGPCPTNLDNQPTPSARPWRYGHAASIEGAHWDIYAGEGIDGWLVGMVTTEADAALIVAAVNDLRARIEGADTGPTDRERAAIWDSVDSGGTIGPGVVGPRERAAGGGLDVERLARALKATTINFGAEPDWWTDLAPRLAAEYERLDR